MISRRFFRCTTRNRNFTASPLNIQDGILPQTSETAGDGGTSVFSKSKKYEKGSQAGGKNTPQSLPPNRDTCSKAKMAHRVSASPEPPMTLNLSLSTLKVCAPVLVDSMHFDRYFCSLAPTNNLTLVWMAFEIVKPDRKLRNTHPTLPPPAVIRQTEKTAHPSPSLSPPDMQQCLPSCHPFHQTHLEFLTLRRQVRGHLSVHSKVPRRHTRIGKRQGRRGRQGHGVWFVKAKAKISAFLFYH